jgi:hypothetical protein
VSPGKSIPPGATENCTPCHDDGQPTRPTRPPRRRSTGNACRNIAGRAADLPTRWHHWLLIPRGSKATERAGTPAVSGPCGRNPSRRRRGGFDRLNKRRTKPLVSRGRHQSRSATLAPKFDQLTTGLDRLKISLSRDYLITRTRQMLWSSQWPSGRSGRDI